MAEFSTDGSTFKISGELDTKDLEPFEEAVGAFLDSTTGDVLFDFSGVDFMASAFLGVLVPLKRRVTASRRGFKVRPSPIVRQLMELTGVAAMMDLVD